MTEAGAIVIVGGGHAAAQLCVGLVEAGLGARVHLVCEEERVPYQRPPLSKGLPEESRRVAARAPRGKLVPGARDHRASRCGDGNRPRSTERHVALRRRSSVRATRSGDRNSRTSSSRHPGGPGNVAVVRTARDADRLRALVPLRNMSPFSVAASSVWKWRRPRAGSAEASLSSKRRPVSVAVGVARACRPCADQPIAPTASTAGGC